MPVRRLIVTVGLPYSGKTTWAKEQGHPMVSADAVRLALHGQRFVALYEPMVWAVVETMVRALFLAGHDTVILDVTENTAKRRERWIGFDLGNGDLARTVFCVFDTPVAKCLERANLANDATIVPIIERQAAEQEMVLASSKYGVMAPD